MFADIDFSDFSIFIFEVNRVFMEEKDKPTEKDAINDEELDGIEIGGISNLQNLTRAVFID